ncbi:hypothetical protein PIROE2DRAFT_11684, partial [Piromyces sp. E2]
MDTTIQDLNIELLEEICFKKKDYQFVFSNISLLIKSLKALNKLLKQLETAEDCIYNLPQIEEILNKSESDFILSNVKLSNTQLWCIQRIRTLMISTEFPRSKYIRRLEESLKQLDYSTTDFYEEIIKEQLSVLKSFVEFNKNENYSMDNISEISDMCIYMLDQPSLILPLIEEIIKARLIMEYTIVHEQEIINTCQNYLNIRNKGVEKIDDDDIPVSRINEYLLNSLIVEALLDAIHSHNKSFIQE